MDTHDETEEISENTMENLLDTEVLCESTEPWDPLKEDIPHVEDLQWLKNEDRQEFTLDQLNSFIKMAPQKQNIDNETNFVDPDLLKNILKGKEIFNELSEDELLKARTRANPFETIKNVFFMNRAALKMANIDAATNFMFTNVDRDLKHDEASPYYFADVCAGPGGFSEYILWRKQWGFKGFGFTLKGDNDFKLYNSTCISSLTFKAYYGALGDGNIYNLKNINDFKYKVLHYTKGLGVHFMMSDGGFSVKGQENLQEVLSKQIYVCQCLMALEIVRPGGYFVTKLFDLFTNFSVGLIYLIHKCFDYISILKPNTSRPANSERYLIGKGLMNNEQTNTVREYLRRIASKLWNIKESGSTQMDIEEIIPVEILKSDKKFYEYMCRSNNYIGENQRKALKKLEIFCKNPLLVENRQDQLRKLCLQHWNIPDKMRPPQQKLEIKDLLKIVTSNPEFMKAPPRKVQYLPILEKIVTDVNEWELLPLLSSKNNSYCNFFVGVNQSKVYKLQKDKWVEVKHLKLVTGTIIYAELVKETCETKNGEITKQFTLHVIDALRLGNVNMADLPFHERLKCIRTYCESLTFDGTRRNIRIRPKVIQQLQDICESTIQFNPEANEYDISLDILDINSKKESHLVNSLLLIRTRDSSFTSTFMGRVVVFINDEIPYDDTFISLDDLCKHVKSII